MRISRLVAIAALALCIPASRTQAQNIGVTINLGPPQVVYAYEPEYYGPWRTTYLQWEPVRLYFVSGVYYARPVQGARVVMVYRRGPDYFFPPRDVAWVGIDRRYEYKYKPQEHDFGRGKPHGGRGRGRKG